MKPWERVCDCRVFLKRTMLGAAGAALAGAWPGWVDAAEDRRPNILMIMTDDQAFEAVGFMGRYPFLETPNMDRLAREGAVFRNAFVTTSLCGPSRATILTGTHAHRHGVIVNRGTHFDHSLPTFATVLQAAGYETGLIGKLHFPETMDPLPGFDYWYGHRGQGTYRGNTFNFNGENIRVEEYYTDHVSRKAAEWMTRPRDKPFCLAVWHKSPHSPYDPPERHANAFADAQVPEPHAWNDDLASKPAWVRARAAFGDRHWRARLAEAPERIPPTPWDPTGRSAQRLKSRLRMLLAVDEGLGVMLEALEESGQLDNTLILYTSDNGLSMYEHHPSFYSKMLMWREPVRVPLLVRYPPLVKPGTAIEGMALNLDFAQTFIELAGAAAPATMQGRSLAPLLAGRDGDWRTSFLYAFFSGPEGKRPYTIGVRTETHKLIVYPHLAAEELYDLVADPHELHNLAADPALADVRARLYAELERQQQAPGFHYPEQDAEAEAD
ncbi:MAG: sulfatase [Candidatus Marinimicrobia bacterium]|nr:sulfatase [Candidatus Neomarinimicrobiota bacterium]